MDFRAKETLLRDVQVESLAQFMVGKKNGSQGGETFEQSCNEIAFTQNFIKSKGTLTLSCTVKS